MAADRQTPCLYYICAGLCKKGRKADHSHYCQHCDKYKPRARVRYKNLDGIHFCFGKHAFMSDESENYEFYILNNNCDSDVWIIQDMNGNIRVWDRTMEELFFW